MQGLVWGEPELAHEYDFDVEKIIAKSEVATIVTIKTVTIKHH